MTFQRARGGRSGALHEAERAPMTSLRARPIGNWGQINYSAPFKSGSECVRESANLSRQMNAGMRPAIAARGAASLAAPIVALLETVASLGATAPL